MLHEVSKKLNENGIILKKVIGKQIKKPRKNGAVRHDHNSSYKLIPEGKHSSSSYSIAATSEGSAFLKNLQNVHHHAYF